MSTTKRATLVGVTALLLAAALIATAVLTGSLPGVSNINTQQKSGTGTLSIMLTDPPVTPTGVSKVYISYSSIEVHVSGAGNKSGWYPVNGAGTIELLGTVNFSQTLGSVSLTTGIYNALRFNITSAAVTYGAHNYTAFVPRSELFVPIIGGVRVNDSKLSATIIDLQTTVMNIGSHSDPEFIIRPVVRAYPVPPGQVTVNMEHLGFRMNLLHWAWWRLNAEKFTANLNVTTATLTGTSLSVTVKDTGNMSTTLGLVTVTSLANFLGGMHPGLHILDSLMSSESFLVMKNGTLVPLRNIDTAVTTAMGGGASAKLSVYQKIFGSSGYNLTKGSSATFTYSGPISIGFLTFGFSQNTVVSGDSYTITVLGTQAVASIVVKAG